MVFSEHNVVFLYLVALCAAFLLINTDIMLFCFLEKFCLYFLLDMKSVVKHTVVENNFKKMVCCNTIRYKQFET